METSSTTPLSDTSVSEWEIEEGLPQLTDPFIQKYLDGREALIEQEKAQRSDYSFRQSLTPLAAEACAIVSRIRDEEHRTAWNEVLQDGVVGQEGAAQRYHPGMSFALAQDKMETTKLWQIVKKMPKGALLHAHMDAMVDIDWLIEQALSVEGLGMMACESLCDQRKRQEVGISFQYTDALKELGDNILWNHDYRSQHLVSVRTAAEKFPDGGIEGFKAWMKSRCTITPEESIEHHHGVDAVWRKFKDCFVIVGSILFYEPILRAAIQRLLRQLSEDGIRWADFRLAFCFEYRKKGCEKPEEGYNEVFGVLEEEIANFKATDEGKQFWGCRMIWTTLRMFDKKAIVQSMKECISVKQSYPDLIAGFDLVGQEDQGRSLADLTPELFWFRKRCVEEGVDIPFFFHAGECLGDGDEADQNLFDAILLGTRRIGHGFSLYKHPLLIEMVKQKKILIESCPISNEILRLTSSIMSHPLPALLSRGVTVALCNDDPAILGHSKNGLTHDFWQALQAWENLGLEGLGSLAENSIRYAAFGPDQSIKEWNKDVRDGINGNGIRAARLREWTAEWNKFCEWIVMEYAADYGDDGE